MFGLRPVAPIGRPATTYRGSGDIQPGDSFYEKVDTAAKDFPFRRPPTNEEAVLNLVRVLLVVAILAPTLHAQTASVAGWRADLNFIAREIERLHPNPFFFTPRETFEAAVAELDAAIPSLSDDQIVAQFHELLALPSLGGRDGHTGMTPIDPAFDSFLPIRTYVFEDKLYILQARAPHEDLEGARILSIGGMPVPDVFDALSPLISRDNRWNVLSKLPGYLVNPHLLHAVGVLPNIAEAELVVERDDGAVFPMIVSGIGPRPFIEWLNALPPVPPGDHPPYLRDVNEAFWLELMPDTGTLYVRYNAVRSQTQSGETMTEFAARIEALIDSASPVRLVIDLRFNDGGDNTTYEPFLAMLETTAAINQRGKLFTITNRETFSAAGNFVTEIERRTETLLVGEPTGGAPNQYGDAVPLELPNSRFRAFVSTRYHQPSDADDVRLTHQPDIFVALTWLDFTRFRDPAMEAILAYEP